MTEIKEKEEIHKVVSVNEKRNTQCVVIKCGGAFYTRHIALDPARKTIYKKKTFKATESPEKKRKRDERDEKERIRKSTMVEKETAA